MPIMQDYASRYRDTIGSLLRLKTFRNEVANKINKLYSLKKQNIEINRKIMKIERELCHG